MGIVNDWEEAEKLILSNKIGLFPTDTKYGLSCLASYENGVEKIYKLKNRDFDKPFIILISDITDLAIFKIKISKIENKLLQEMWPGPVSIILNCTQPKYEFLHRGKNSLAFRLPAFSKLQNFLRETGPIVTTSANIQGGKPADSVIDAMNTFGEKLDFYFDIGPLNNPLSKIIKIENDSKIIIRP